MDRDFLSKPLPHNEPPALSNISVSTASHWWWSNMVEECACLAAVYFLACTGWWGDTCAMGWWGYGRKPELGWGVSEGKEDALSHSVCISLVFLPMTAISYNSSLSCLTHLDLLTLLLYHFFLLFSVCLMHLTHLPASLVITYFFYLMNS